jgi:hypothetical protein
MECLARSDPEEIKLVKRAASLVPDLDRERDVVLGNRPWGSELHFEPRRLPPYLETEEHRADRENRDRHGPKG